MFESQVLGKTNVSFLDDDDKKWQFYSQTTIKIGICFPNFDKLCLILKYLKISKEQSIGGTRFPFDNLVVFTTS